MIDQADFHPREPCSELSEPPEKREPVSSSDFAAELLAVAGADLQQPIAKKTIGELCPSIRSLYVPIRLGPKPSRRPCRVVVILAAFACACWLPSHAACGDCNPNDAGTAAPAPWVNFSAVECKEHDAQISPGSPPVIAYDRGLRPTTAQRHARGAASLYTRRATSLPSRNRSG